MASKFDFTRVSFTTKDGSRFSFQEMSCFECPQGDWVKYPETGHACDVDGCDNQAFTALLDHGVTDDAVWSIQYLCDKDAILALGHGWAFKGALHVRPDNVESS